MSMKGRLAELWRISPILFLVVFAVIAVAAALLTFGTPAQREAKKLEVANKAAAAEMDLANNAVINGDAKKALYHANQAVKASPENLEAIVLAAELVGQDNPTEAKKLYGRALAVYKEQENFDTGKPNAIQNWTAAGLAEDAGKTDEALKYYKQVLVTADRKDGYQSALVRQSSESIERLR